MPGNVDDEGLKEAYEAAAQHNWTREEYDAYIYAGIREQDEKGRVEKAEEKTRNKLIISFYDNGVSLDMIAKSIGLSQEEVSEIIKNKRDH